MESSNKIIAGISTFVEFLDEALKSEDKIKEMQVWVQANLIDKNPCIDDKTKQYFFKAQKELICAYLTNGSIDKIQKLIALFDDFTDVALKRLEFKIFTGVLQEKKDNVALHPEYHLALSNILNNTFLKVNIITDPSYQDLLLRFEQTTKLLGDTPSAQDHDG